jgi:hypothetical protein
LGRGQRQRRRRSRRASEGRQPDHIRLGFRLVGRREQQRFARRACERMGELVARGLVRTRAWRSAPAHA